MKSLFFIFILFSFSSFTFAEYSWKCGFKNIDKNEYVELSRNGNYLYQLKFNYKDQETNLELYLWDQFFCRFYPENLAYVQCVSLDFTRYIETIDQGNNQWMVNIKSDRLIWPLSIKNKTNFEEKFEVDLNQENNFCGFEKR